MTLVLLLAVMLNTTQDGLATWLWRDVRVDLRAAGDWRVRKTEEV